jgi:hypothetical protein
VKGYCLLNQNASTARDAPLSGEARRLSLWMMALYPSIDDDYCAHPQSHKQRSCKHGEEAVRFDGGKHDPKEQRHDAETPKVADRKNRSIHVVSMANPPIVQNRSDPDLFERLRAPRRQPPSRFPKQLRQPRDVDGDPSRLVLGQDLGLPCLGIVVAGAHEDERLSVGVPDDIAAGDRVDPRPPWRQRNARRLDANWMADGECREQA